MTNRKTNPNQMPLRMLWAYVGRVSLRAVESTPDGKLRAICVEMEGSPGEIVEFVERMREDGVTVNEDDQTIPLLLPAAGEGGR